jgi:hypothetical protein
MKTTIFIPIPVVGVRTVPSCESNPTNKFPPKIGIHQILTLPQPILKN